jgi:hypothetical protein
MVEIIYRINRSIKSNSPYRAVAHTPAHAPLRHGSVFVPTYYSIPPPFSCLFSLQPIILLSPSFPVRYLTI